MKITDIITENKQGVAEGSLEEIDRRGFLKGMGAAAIAGAGMIPKAAEAWFFFIIPLPNMNPDAAANACMSPDVKIGQKVTRHGKPMEVQKIHGVSNRCQNPNMPVAVTVIDLQSTESPKVIEPPEQNMLPYGEKVGNAIKSRINWPVAEKYIQGNPMVEVEVELLPNGEVVNIKIIQPSGLDAWDEAVIDAIKRLRVFPKRDDGTVFRKLHLTFRPKVTSYSEKPK